MRSAFLIMALAATAVSMVAALPTQTGPVAQVLQLYRSGEYRDCLGLVNRLIEDHDRGLIRMPRADMAAVHLISACLWDVLRSTGWSEGIDASIGRALALDPNVDGALVEDRPLVSQRLDALRAALLEQTGAAGRPFSLGLVVAADGPAGLPWTNAVLIGVRGGAAINNHVGLELDALLITTGGPGTRGQLLAGVAWRPAFALRQPIFIGRFAYVASRDDAWSHGLALSAGGELFLQEGAQFRLMVDVLRVDAGQPPAAAASPAIPMGGSAVAFGFPRLTFSAAVGF